MAKPSTKSKAIKKAPKGPSSLSTKKSKSVSKTPVKTSTAKKNTKAKKRTPKPLNVKVHGKNPALDKIIHRNLLAYFKERKLKVWGNNQLDADSKGYDGYDSLYLKDYVKDQIGKKISETNIDSIFDKYSDIFIKAATRNVWQWANFCQRLWVETQQADPPVRRLVNMNLTEIMPYSDYGIASKFIASINKDLLTALTNLGTIRSKVRFVISFDETHKLNARDSYKLFDALKFVPSEKSIWGLMFVCDKQTDYCSYPRETVILCPQNLRKSKEAERYISEASNLGYRVVIPFDLLRDGKSSIQEIKSSNLYTQLVKSWKGLRPIVTIGMDSPMARKKKLSMISKLSDILLV